MTALTVKKMETASLPQLLKGFEQCMDIINQSRAMMFKIVSVIEERQLLTKKYNYNQKQLNVLKANGITEPWKYSTREVLSGLYSHFSWSQYIKYGKLANKLDIKTASRVSEDALIVMNRNRHNIEKIMPDLKKTKGIISRSMVQTIVDKKIKTTVKKPVKKDVVEQPTVTVLNAKNREIKRLQTALKKSLDLNVKLNEEIKTLRKKMRTLS